MNTLTHHITTRMAHDITAGDVLPNRGTVMSNEHVNSPEGDALVVLWFRKDGTDDVTVFTSELTSWTEEAHRMVWVCAPDE
jgi:hypothetical protein